MVKLHDILPLLHRVKYTNDVYTALCPAHDDKINSLSLRESKDGKLLLYCHAGCSFNKIIQSLNIQCDTPEKPVLTNTYDYTDEEGKLIYQSLRYKPKNFRARRPDVDGGWIWNLDGIEHILYNLPNVTKTIDKEGVVYCVEGEKDVNNLSLYDLVGTCTNGGSSVRWSPIMLQALHHANVVIIPDNDKAGREYAEALAKDLYGWCDSLKMARLPVGDKGDVSDYLELNGVDKLLNIVDNCGQYIPIGAVTREEFNMLKRHVIYTRELMSKKKEYNNYVL